MYKSPYQCVKTDIVQMRLPFTLNECNGIACDDCYFKGVMQGTYCIVMRKILTLDKVKEPYMVSFAEEDLLKELYK